MAQGIREWVIGFRGGAHRVSGVGGAHREWVGFSGLGVGGVQWPGSGWANNSLVPPGPLFICVFRGPGTRSHVTLDTT